MRRKADETARVFGALADPTRRRIVELLADGGPTRVADLAAELAVSRQAVAKHLDVLGAAGLTTTARRGRERLTSVAGRAFDPLAAWLERYGRFWDGRLLQLRALVERREKGQKRQRRAS